MSLILIREKIQQLKSTTLIIKVLNRHKLNLHTRMFLGISETHIQGQKKLYVLVC